jgi:hypothetical protein
MCHSFGEFSSDRVAISNLGACDGLWLRLRVQSSKCWTVFLHEYYSSIEVGDTNLLERGFVDIVT